MTDATPEQPTVAPLSAEWERWFLDLQRASDHLTSLGRIVRSVERLYRKGAVPETTYGDAMQNYALASARLMQVQDNEPPMFEVE